MNEIASRMTGANCNVEGKQTRKIMRYKGGLPAFRERCDALAANGYRGLTFSYPPAERRPLFSQSEQWQLV
jgi:hypothetical protein